MSEIFEKMLVKSFCTTIFENLLNNFNTFLGIFSKMLRKLWLLMEHREN